MSIDVQSNNKRIAKNTMYMYLRMGVTMLVQLYTSRVVLNYLGVEDYGIYNVVAAFIVAFSYLSAPLSSATQRFLSFELGRKDNIELNRVFNLSIYTYALMSILLVVIIEVAGVWYVGNKMVLPYGRLEAAYWAFHLSVIALVFSLFRAPLEALIIAHEKMEFYAYMSVADVLLKLGNAFSLMFFTCDKLKLYSINQFTISVIIVAILALYCKRSFSHVKICNIIRIWDKEKFVKMISFSGWSLFGSMASMTANQGLSVLLNMFFGVVVNAAMGIASQINNAVNQFATNFQVAFRPQIVKYYAEGQFEPMRNLIFRTSKFSYLLLFAIVCPVCFNMQFMLEIWLKTPPLYSSEFCIFMLLFTLSEALAAPLWMSIQASGRISKYQIVVSSVTLSILILSFLLLKQGYPAVTVFIIKFIIDIIILGIRLLFVRNTINLPIIDFFRFSIIPSGMVTISCVIPMVITSIYLSDGWLHLFASSILFLLIYTPMVLYVAMSKNERLKIIGFIKSKL